MVYCSVCKTHEISRTKKDLPLADHTAGEAVEENRVESSCTEAGSYDEVIYCSVCKTHEISRTKKDLPLADHTPNAAVIENMIASTYQKVGSYDSVVYCEDCGTELNREQKAALLNPFMDVSMNLGNNLEAIFKLNIYTLPKDTTYYALISKYGPDGTATTTQVNVADWSGSSLVRRIVYSDIVAKEMCDRITVVICNEQGEAISVAFEMTVRDFAMDQINTSFAALQQNSADELNAKYMSLLVDLLNYGSAAQTYFTYNTDDLANEQLTAEHLVYASTDATAENKQTVGTAYSKTLLSAGGKIDMNFYFDRRTIGIVNRTDLYAEITYKHWHETEYTTLRVDGSSFKQSGGNWVIVFDKLDIPDGYEDVTVKIFDLNGTEKASVTDSVLSCLARMMEADPTEPVYGYMVKFVKSSYDYMTYRKANA